MTGKPAIHRVVFLGALAPMLVAELQMARQGVSAKGKRAEPAPAA